MANVKHTEICCQVVSCKCCTIFIAHTRWQDKAVWSRHHYMLSVQVSSVLITQNAVPHLQHQRNFLDIITCYPVQEVMFRIPKENYWKLHSARGWYSHPELRSLWGSRVSAAGKWKSAHHWVSSCHFSKQSNEVHKMTLKNRIEIYGQWYTAWHDICHAAVMTSGHKDMTHQFTSCSPPTSLILITKGLSFKKKWHGTSF